MFWKRKPKVVIEREPAPCGNDADHYYWKDDGWPCPRCRAKATVAAENERKRLEQEQKERDMDMLAEKIATKLAEKLRVPAACPGE